MLVSDHIKNRTKAQKSGETKKKCLQLRGHRQLLPKKKGIDDGDDEAKNRSRKRGPRTRTSRRREGSPPISRTEPPSDSTSSSSPALRCRATLFLLSIKNAFWGSQLIQFNCLATRSIVYFPYSSSFFSFFFLEKIISLMPSLRMYKSIFVRVPTNYPKTIFFLQMSSWHFNWFFKHFRCCSKYFFKLLYVIYNNFFLYF